MPKVVLVVKAFRIMREQKMPQKFLPFVLFVRWIKVSGRCLTEEVGQFLISLLPLRNF